MIDNRFEKSVSDRTDWGTPLETVRAIERLLKVEFDLDVCATEENAKCVRYISPGEDSLVTAWNGKNCFMNPPYGPKVGDWFKKVVKEIVWGKPNLIACLLPARTDTRWWHKWVWLAEEVYLLKGRIRFVGAMAGARFPSALIVFKEGGGYDVTQGEYDATEFKPWVLTKEERGC